MYDTSSSMCFSNNLPDMTGKFNADVCANAKIFGAVSCRDTVVKVGGNAWERRSWAPKKWH